MEKSKKFFIIIFTVLLLAMTSVVVSLYDNVKKNTPKKDNVALYVEDELQCFTIAMARELEPDYEPLMFSDNIDSETKQIIT